MRGRGGEESPSTSGKGGQRDALLITGSQAQQASISAFSVSGVTWRGYEPVFAERQMHVPQEVSEELLTSDVSLPEETLLPCSLNAVTAGLSGGALGAVLGFGMAAFFSGARNIALCFACQIKPTVKVMNCRWQSSTA